MVQQPQRSPHTRRPQTTGNLNQLDAQESVGDRLSEALARVAGSWTFVVGFCGALIAWVGVNGLQLLLTPFDPYPYVLLNLIVASLAAFQAPLVLMRLNRLAARDRLAAELDHAARFKAEVAAERIEEKLDRLHERHLAEIVELQQHQIRLLERLLDERRWPVPVNGAAHHR